MGPIGTIFSLLQLLAHPRQHEAPIVNRIVEVVVAADGDQLGAEVDVVEERVDDGLDGAHEGRGRAARVGRRDGGVPERAVLDLAALRDVEQPLGADVLGRRGPGRHAALAVGPVALQRVERAVRLGPGQLLGLRDDGPERDPDARAVLAPGLLGFGVDAVDLLLGLLKRLAPQSL